MGPPCAISPTRTLSMKDVVAKGLLLLEGEEDEDEGGDGCWW